MPITKAEAQEVTRAFVRDYPGALELAYKFREDAAELYGPRAAEVPQDMKGGYVPKETQHAGRAYRGRVDVPLANVEDAGDLLLTLRHEVLGHYGANTFAPAEKRALLDGLVAAREEPSLKPLWDDIDRRYAGYPVDVRAEEVFALYCEGIEPSHHQARTSSPRAQTRCGRRASSHSRKPASPACGPCRRTTCTTSCASSLRACTTDPGRSRPFRRSTSYSEGTTRWSRKSHFTRQWPRS